VSRDRRAIDPLPELTVNPDILDELLAMLKDRRQRAPSQLFLCFDDGYADAAAYVAERAPLHPSVRWLFFVCPEKIERRAGFRWDLFETTADMPSDGAVLDVILKRDLDIANENQRPELQKLGDSEIFRLASVAQCAQLATIENVALGNHTNCHFRLTDLTLADAERELRNSTETFERLFGACRHLALPFGTPGDDFTDDHLRMATRIRPLLCWSTQQRPFRPNELGTGAVVPRFTVYQFRNVKAMAAKICLLSTLFRLRALISPSLSSAPPSSDRRPGHRTASARSPR
jgi:peptidoglycan/xylan/chitin deacetylase (PgdA/CDA1 family)